MKANEQKTNSNAAKFLQAVKYQDRQTVLRILGSGEKVADLLMAKDTGIRSFRSSGWTALHWILHFDDLDLLEKVVNKLSANELAAILQLRTDEPWRLFFRSEKILGYEYRKKLGFNGTQTPLHFIKSDKAMDILAAVFNRKFATEQMSKKLGEIFQLKDALDNTPPYEYSVVSKGHALDNLHACKRAGEHYLEEYKYYDANVKDIAKEFLEGNLVKGSKIVLKSMIEGSLKGVDNNPKKKLFLNVLDILLANGAKNLQGNEAIAKAARIASEIISSGLDIVSLDKAKLLLQVEAYLEPAVAQGPRLGIS